MTDEQTVKVSGARLRIGVLFIFLWWAPFWALSPAIADFTGIKVSYITFVIVAVQTTLGFLGFWVAGKQVVTVIKQTPRKKVPGQIWHVLVHGEL